MNTTTKISMSAKDAAIETLAAFDAYSIVKRNGVIAGNALDALPKTPTGKDTKAVKEAKKANLETTNNAYNEYRRKAGQFGVIFRTAVCETNRMHANAFTVDKVMESFGYTYSPDYTDKTKETTVSIKQFNKAQKEAEKPSYPGHEDKHGYILYSYENDRVYVKGDNHVVINFSDRVSYTYSIRYAGGSPRLTAFGLAYFRNYCYHGMSTFEHDILSDLRVNFSAIGREFGPHAAKRLAAISELIDVADALMTKAPFVSVRDLCAEYDHDLMQACANGEAIAVIRHTADDRDGTVRFNRIVTQAQHAQLKGETIHVAAISVTEPQEIRSEDNEENL